MYDHLSYDLSIFLSTFEFSSPFDLSDQKFPQSLLELRVTYLQLSYAVYNPIS